jgi:hypothetical protein
MMQAHDFSSIADDELLRNLSALLSQSRRIEVDLVAHIAEVDHRRLYLALACSSMFVYCVEVLHLSEPEAYLRIAVGRAARRFPAIGPMLGNGRLHLSGIALLAPHLTEKNCDDVLARASNRTKRQIEELISELAPKPDAPPTIRKLPDSPAPPPPRLRPDKVVSSATTKPMTTPPPRPEPLSPERYKIAFTASKEVKEKLERLQALMGEDLAAVIEAAVTEKLERLEAKRYGQTKRPRKTLRDTDTSPESRYMPAAVRRIVWERDGQQCTFVDRKGRRCKERHRLEFHHDDPYGRGGDHDPSRIRLLCAGHNFHVAELDYGKEVMQRYRRKIDRVREAATGYGLMDWLDRPHGERPAMYFRMISRGIDWLPPAT